MSNDATKAKLVLDTLRIDLERSTIESDGAPSGLTPRAESLLLLLCRSANKLVTREQILDQIWTGRVVEDAAITNTIWQIRKALGERGKDILQTRAKRGYILQVPDDAWLPDEDSGEHAPAPGIAEAVPALSEVGIREQDTVADRNAPRAPAALEQARARIRGLRVLAAALGLAALAVVGVYLWRASPVSPSRTATMTLAPDAELTVSVQVPETLGWLRDAVLRAAVEQAYLRDGEVVYFEKRQQRNPFAGPHLHVEVRAENADGIVAELSLNQNGKTERESFRGPKHQLADATKDFLRHVLQPPVRKPTGATDALVAGLAADLRFDTLTALQEYRRALGKDSRLADAKIAMLSRLFGLGRQREALEMLTQLQADKTLTEPQRCKLALLAVRIAPEQVNGEVCARAKSLADFEKIGPMDALRATEAARGRKMGARAWFDNEITAIDARMNADDLPGMESQIVLSERTASLAGWERARIEFASWRADINQQQGKIGDAARLMLASADEMEALGDVQTALYLRTFGLRIQRPTPGEMTERQRTALREIVERARALGSPRAEVDALQILVRLDRHNLPLWQSHLDRIRKLIEAHYAPTWRIQQSQFILNEVLGQRRYGEVLEAVSRFEKAGIATPRATIWNLTLKAQANFQTDRLGEAIAAVDALEKGNFDLSQSLPCTFAWLMIEAGRPDRTRLLLKKCPYAEFDSAGKAGKGDFGLLAEARMHQSGDDPERAWPMLRPRIDELLAAPKLMRQEVESLALLARHATSMPGADFNRLGRVSKTVSELAAKDDAGPNLRFGAHLLRWRLCAAEGREDCGPVLPAWAREDRLEARLAAESVRRPMAHD